MLIDPQLHLHRSHTLGPSRGHGPPTGRYRRELRAPHSAAPGASAPEVDGHEALEAAGGRGVGLGLLDFGDKGVLIGDLERA